MGLGPVCRPAQYCLQGNCFEKYKNSLQYFYGTAEILEIGWSSLTKMGWVHIMQPDTLLGLTGLTKVINNNNCEDLKTGQLCQYQL